MARASSSRLMRSMNEERSLEEREHFLRSKDAHVALHLGQLPSRQVRRLFHLVAPVARRAP